jgi:hypothetical protein
MRTCPDSVMCLVRLSGTAEGAGHDGLLAPSAGPGGYAVSTGPPPGGRRAFLVALPPTTGGGAFWVSGGPLRVLFGIGADRSGTRSESVRTGANRCKLVQTGANWSGGNLRKSCINSE